MNPQANKTTPRGDGLTILPQIDCLLPSPINTYDSEANCNTHTHGPARPKEQTTLEIKDEATKEHEDRTPASKA